MSCQSKNQKSQIKNIFCFAVLCSYTLAAVAVEPVLMRAGTHTFTVSDFEYVYHRNHHAAGQKLDDCLSLYIPYKLKIVAAKETGLDTLPDIVDEWKKYRDQLTTKILKDTIINELLLRDRKIMSSDRMSAGIARFADKLKEKYHFIEDTVLLKNIFQEKQYTNSKNPALFSFAGQNVTLVDFEQYQATAKLRKHNFVTAEYMYQQFVSEVLLDYENSRLEINHKDFRDITGEYLDGILLFAISDREVWSKAKQDSSGLTNFYKKNAKSYRWGKRMDATVYYCSDKKVATRVSRTIREKNEGTGRLPEGLYTFFCEADGKNPCIDTIRRTLPKGANTLADRFKWKKGCSKIMEWNGNFVFLDIHDILRPRRKTFEEARGEVIADYQDELENKWIEQLKKKYPVTIDEIVWADLKKKYAE